ncbi:MAG: site-specific integrase [Gammaproteobacteria bacterium]|nr:site-specific integrase [Gammaproteobacteria bacterium]MDZ7752569.1 site-specific integrase [Gammaproteobacteria bacterium]
MQPIVERLWTLRHEPVGPLTPFLDAFASHLDAQGFKRHLLGRQIRVVAYFSCWLEAKQIPARSITDEQVGRFFGSMVGRPVVQAGERAALGRFVDFLRQRDIIGPLPVPTQATPVQQTVRAFAEYLQQERALSDRTLIKYCPFVEQFLSECFGQGQVKFQTLRAADVIRFVRQQAAHLSPSVAKSATTALRAFFRYLHHSGLLSCDLVAAVPTVPNWSMTGIPRAIAAEHVRAVLAHCPRNTPVGRRDYAILLLLARLGLRAGEIVSLSLESIDWEAGVISICGKGAQPASLPLPTDVGEAIADYLRHGRPRSDSRRLFLRAVAPLRGLGAAQTVTTLVGAALRRAGVDAPHHGAHQFRHALAIDMLRHGAALTEIASVLRHRHIKTTSIYAKVDFAALRPLSAPWPGGAI